MKRKTFARTKEQIATGKVACAVGSAQNAKVLQIPTKPHKVRFGNSIVSVSGGRNLDAPEARRIVAQVSLGKRSVLFRLGNDAKERQGAIDELVAFLKGSKVNGKPRVRFDFRFTNCIAAVALEELAIDMCSSCLGAGQVRDHSFALEGRQPMKLCPSCMGSRRRRYVEDERVIGLAGVWAREYGGDARQLAKDFRKMPKVGEMVSAIDFAKGILIEAERVAVEETAAMLERF